MILTTGRILLASLTTMNANATAPLTYPMLAHRTAQIGLVARDSTTVQVPEARYVAGGPISAYGNAVTPEEQALFDQTNLDRQEAGESTLVIDPLLCRVARSHSQDMAQRQYFAHEAPEPGPATPLDRYVAALGFHPDFAAVGENIYYRSATDGLNDSAEQANHAFMNSPGHRENILRTEFTKIGIGFYRDPNTGEFWVTEMFLRDKE
jgi:uncharacterized protein YkwD